jgi:hypothetical protein
MVARNREFGGLVIGQQVIGQMAIDDFVTVYDNNH